MYRYSIIDFLIYTAACFGCPDQLSSCRCRILKIKVEIYRDLVFGRIIRNSLRTTERYDVTNTQKNLFHWCSSAQSFPLFRRILSYFKAFCHSLLTFMEIPHVLRLYCCTFPTQTTVQNNLEVFDVYTFLSRKE